MDVYECTVKGAVGSALCCLSEGVSVRCTNWLCDVSAHRQEDHGQAPRDPRRLFPHGFAPGCGPRADSPDILPQLPGQSQAGMGR